MIPAYIFWLAAVIAFGIAEAATLGLTSLWFAVGALAAMVCAICHGPLWLQVGLFVAVSGLCLVFVRNRFQNRFNDSRQPTNADRIIGHRGQVLETIDNTRAAGTVKVDGAVWSARSRDGQDIPEGTEVAICAIEGVKVIVIPAASES